MTKEYDAEDRDDDCKGGSTSKIDKKFRIPIDKIKLREDADDDTVTENSGTADFGMNIEDAQLVSRSALSKSAKDKR